MNTYVDPITLTICHTQLQGAAAFYRTMADATTKCATLTAPPDYKIKLQQFRVIRDHPNSKCLISICLISTIVFDIQVRSSIQ